MPNLRRSGRKKEEAKASYPGPWFYIIQGCTLMWWPFYCLITWGICLYYYYFYIYFLLFSRYRFQCQNPTEIAGGSCKSQLQRTICNQWMVNVPFTSSARVSKGGGVLSLPVLGYCSTQSYWHYLSAEKNGLSLSHMII